MGSESIRSSHKQGLQDFSSYIPLWVPFPDERDNDDTLIEFAKMYLVPRAQVIYNLKTHHVELILHKKLPRIVKESRRKHAKLKKGQFIAGASALIVVIAGSLEAAAVSVPQSLTHEGRYDSFSDVGESRVWFASKNLTPCTMH